MALINNIFAQNYFSSYLLFLILLPIDIEILQRKSLERFRFM